MGLDNRHIDLEKLSPGDTLVQITYGGWGGDQISIRKLTVVKVLKTQLVLKHESTDREVRVIVRYGQLTNEEYGQSSSRWHRSSVNLHHLGDPAIEEAKERMRRSKARLQVRKLSEALHRDPNNFESALELQQALGEWIDILKVERSEEENDA